MRERFLETKLEPKSNENPSKCVRGSVSEESEHESFTPPSRPLFEEEVGRAPKEKPGITASDPLEQVGPRSRCSWVDRPMGSAGPLWGPLIVSFCQTLPQWFKTLKMWCTAVGVSYAQ